MTNSSSIQKEYRKQRQRIERYYKKYEKLGYQRTENALPKVPKRITEASVRRLASYTPEKMQKNLMSHRMYYRDIEGDYETTREYKEFSLYEEKHQTHFGENYFGRTKYKEYKKSYELRKEFVELHRPKIEKYRHEATIEELESYDYWSESYHHDSPRDYKWDDKTDWTRWDYEQASDEMGIDYKDMSETDLDYMDLTRTDEGFIVSNSTGEIIAKDVSEDIKKNREFLAQLRDHGFKDSSILSEETQEAIKTKLPDADDATINIFLSEARKYPKEAYDYIAGVLSEMESLASDSPNLKHAMAMAIEKTIQEEGHISNAIAYSSQRLAEYRSSLLSNFNISRSALESLNDALEQDETYFEE